MQSAPFAAASADEQPETEPVQIRRHCARYRLALRRPSVTTVGAPPTACGWSFPDGLGVV